MASRATVITIQRSVPVGCTRDNRAVGGLFRFGIEHLAAAIEAIGGHLVPAVGFTAGLVDRQRGLLERVMRTAHATTRRRYSAFLNSHGSNPLSQKKLLNKMSTFVPAGATPTTIQSVRGAAGVFIRCFAGHTANGCIGTIGITRNNSSSTSSLNDTGRSTVKASASGARVSTCSPDRSNSRRVSARSSSTIGSRQR